MATDWTTRLLPEITRRYGVAELHTGCFAPRGWTGKGVTVSLGLPECELVCVTLAADGEPVAMINRPQHERNIRYWTRAACELAVEQQAFMIITCDTAAQLQTAVTRAARRLPSYQRVALERMYDSDTRVADMLS